MDQQTQHVTVVRVAEQHWHALEDDLVVGRGHTIYRRDGRVLVSVDAWHARTFDLIAAAMLAALPRPLHTLVDASDRELDDLWRGHGFVPHRREWEHVVPTDPQLTGLADASPPRGVAIRTTGSVTLATWYGERFGHLRLAPIPRRPVVAELVVRPDVRRRGIARALMARVLGDLHDAGTREVSAVVDEADAAGTALAGAVGGRRTWSNLELVLR